MRSPVSGLRPVVSVSKTISRMAGLCVPGLAETSNDAANRVASLLHRAAGVDDEVGPGALLRIRHLLREDSRELLLAHSGAGENPGALNLGGCGNHGDLVHVPPTFLL